MKGCNISRCGICDSIDLEAIWDLPKLPLTEKYGTYSSENTLCSDQTLLLCGTCGHVQMSFQIDPLILYTEKKYAFRTKSSKTAVAGTHFFHQFYKDLTGSRQFNSLVDIGGNGTLLAELIENVQEKCVVDPVFGDQGAQTDKGVRLLGAFIEKLDFEAADLAPDLIFCRHVIEHLAHPKTVLNALFEKCKSDTLYVFELPCFESLVEASRFDAVFHQHYHYYDLVRFKRLLYECGGEFIDHRYHRAVSCGGALLIAFKKATTKVPLPQMDDLKVRKTNFLEAIKVYSEQMKLLKWQLQKFKGEIYGYGASLMLATLGYHMNTDFSELICILDDDQQKEGISYENVPVCVRSTSSVNPPPGANYLITSLESVRNIYNNITTNLQPRRVLTPFII